MNNLVLVSNQHSARDQSLDDACDQRRAFRSESRARVVGRGEWTRAGAFNALGRDATFARDCIRFSVSRKSLGLSH